MLSIPFIDLPPLRSASGSVRLPGSKSISNRVLLLAALSEGTTLVHDLLASDDTQVMLDSLSQLGCGIRREGGSWCVDGIGGQLRVREAKLFLGNAGTAMRPLTAALAVLAAAQGGQFELSGVPRMHERPIGDLVDALRLLGCDIECFVHEGYPPLRLKGGTLRLDAPIKVRGDVSSQFLTALLMALPLVATDRPLTIEVVGELISKPYIEITLNLLARFGVAVQRGAAIAGPPQDGGEPPRGAGAERPGADKADWERFVIPAGSSYRSPGEIHVEGDASSASYFIALGALAATEEPLRIEGVGSGSIQGDIRFVEAAEAMGAKVTSGPSWLEVRRGTWPLQAITLDCNHIPDAAMTLAVMALYAKGTTKLTNIASWRVKETDRIAAMATELRKLGAMVEEGVDYIAVTPPAAWKAAAIRTYDDHRMAMCFSLAAFNKLAASQPVPVRILDPRCVGKTFPDYFETLLALVQADPTDVPVVTIDGPTASGKGTLANALAQALGYHWLDSGMLYRATALAALEAKVSPEDEAGLARLAAALDLQFSEDSVSLFGREVGDLLRREEVGLLASKISAWPAVRTALVGLQKSFRRAPGLVADGRDMGTVIFPEAALKVFLTASAAMRADRRYKQLISKGISANIDNLLADLEARDARDKNRSVAPLKPAEDAQLLDNSALTIEASVEHVLQWWDERRPFKQG